MTKQTAHNAARVGILIVLLLVVVFCYPRPFNSKQAIWLIPPPFSSPVSASVFYVVLLLFLDALASRWCIRHSVQPHRAAPPAAVVAEKVGVSLSVGLFLAFLWMVLAFDSLYVLYWQMEPVLIGVWAVCLAVELFGALYIELPLAASRYFYMGALGCVAAFGLYYGLPKAVVLHPWTLFCEYMLPLHVAGLVAFVARHKTASKAL